MNIKAGSGVVSREVGMEELCQPERSQDSGAEGPSQGSLQAYGEACGEAGGTEMCPGDE